MSLSKAGHGQSEVVVKVLNHPAFNVNDADITGYDVILKYLIILAINFTNYIISMFVQKLVVTVVFIDINVKKKLTSLKLSVRTTCRSQTSKTAKIFWGNPIWGSARRSLQGDSS